MYAAAALVCSLALLAAGSVEAQITKLPGAAEPGRPETKPPSLPAAPVELRWIIKLPPGPEPPKNLRDETLELEDLILEGVTAYKRAELLDLFEHHLGKTITFAQFYAISRAIQSRYQKDGYILSFSYVPPQTVEFGVFKIAVVEGYIDRVVVEDLKGTLKRTIERTLAPLTRSRPLRSSDLERYLLLANDLAGVRLTGVLQPSKTTRGATELVAKATHKLFGGGASIDNRASEFTGRWQAMADLSTSSLFGMGEWLAVNFSEANGFDELVSFGASYSQPMGSEGLRADSAIGYSVAHPGFTLDSFDVRTESLTVDLDISSPLIRSRAQTLNLAAGFTVRDTEVELLDAKFSRDRLRLLRAHVGYNHAGILGGTSGIALDVSQGVPIFGASDPDDDTTSRADAQPTFTKAVLDVVHLQPIVDGLSLQIAAIGQYARAPLPASEEFAVGGSRFGRAYNSGEATGEDGVAVSLETGYDIRTGTPLIRQFRPYGFYDFGKAWDRKSSSSTGSHQSVASAGIGLRTRFISGGTLRIEYGYPLTHQPSNQSGDKHGRLFVFGGWRF